MQNCAPRGALPSLPDHEGPAGVSLEFAGQPPAFVAGIGNDGADPGPKWRQTADKAFARPPVRYAGRLAAAGDQQPERVDQDVALATRDLLASIIALRIERSPPFCAAFALWLSMIPTLGLASRPSCSRTAT